MELDAIAQGSNDGFLRQPHFVPSPIAGRTVQAVRPVPMPTTCAGFTRLAASVCGTAVRSTSTQSAGTCSAQSGGSGAPVLGSPCSRTARPYGRTALASSAPSATRTTRANPDRVPKSTPTTTLRDSRSSVLLVPATVLERRRGGGVAHQQLWWHRLRLRPLAAQ
jgi:hypothetical protein